MWWKLSIQFLCNILLIDISENISSPLIIIIDCGYIIDFYTVGKFILMLFFFLVNLNNLEIYYLISIYWFGIRKPLFRNALYRFYLISNNRTIGNK